MKKQIITRKSPIPAGPYSQGIICGDRIYIAGQGPVNVETNIVPLTIREQTRQTLINIKNILEEGGSSLEKVVKVSVFLTDLKYFEEFNTVYNEFFKKPYPARTTIGCQLNNILVEIDVIAEI
jgi:2-iminobutanoate/2-iminopropanoate deaminase